MQTFLPLSLFYFNPDLDLKLIDIYTFLYWSFYASLSCLDNRRLNKQRVEAKQIINIIYTRKTFKLHGKVDSTTLKSLKKNNPEIKFGWINHIATLMWENYLNELILYYNLSIDVWKTRKNKDGKSVKNTLDYYKFDEDKLSIPCFMGDEKFHASHRSALLYKDFEYYKQFSWKEIPELNYIWP